MPTDPGWGVATPANDPKWSVGNIGVLIDSTPFPEIVAVEDWVIQTGTSVVYTGAP